MTSTSKGLIDVDIDQVLQTTLYTIQKAFWKDLEERLQRVAPVKRFIWRNLEYTTYIPIILEGVLHDYFGSWYKGINSILRKDPKETSFDDETLTWFTQARVISFMTRRGTTAPVDMTLYRGTFYSKASSNPHQIDSKYQPGMIVEYSQLLSTTNSIEVARTFSGKEWNERGLRIIYILQVPKGSPFHVKRLDRDVYNRKNEPEIVFPNCTRWVVDRREPSNDDLGRVYIYMHLKEVGADITQKPIDPHVINDAEITALASHINDYVVARITREKNDADEKAWKNSIRPRLINELKTYRKSPSCGGYLPMTAWNNQRPTPLQQKVAVDPSPSPVKVELEENALSQTFDSMSLNSNFSVPSPASLPAARSQFVETHPRPTHATAAEIAASISEVPNSDIAAVTRTTSARAIQFMTSFFKQDNKTKANLAKQVLESNPVDPDGKEIKKTIESAILATQPIQTSAPIVPSDRPEKPSPSPSGNTTQVLPYGKRKYLRQKSISRNKTKLRRRSSLKIRRRRRYNSKSKSRSRYSSKSKSKPRRPKTRPRFPSKYKK